MNETLHRAAMALDAEAQLLDVAGRYEAAREKLEEAAALEEGCADDVGMDEPRVRGIVRVSAVSMWMQAALLDRAEAAGRRYLAEPLLPGFHREISALLEQIAERRKDLKRLLTQVDKMGAKKGGS
jgi:hypothetical protein